MGFFDGVMPVLGAVGGGLIGGPAGALIGAGVGGAMSTNSTNMDIANQANQNAQFLANINNQFNSAEAQKTRDWQEQMRKTQYQTAVGDLQAAGLNPMLAYTNGGSGNLTGATASSAGNPQVHMAQIKNPYESMMSNATSIASLKADLDLKEQMITKGIAETKNLEKQAQYTDAQTASEVLRMPGIPEQIKNITKQGLLLDAQRNLTSADTVNSLERNPPWWARYLENKGNSAQDYIRRNWQNSPLYKDLFK